MNHEWDGLAEWWLDELNTDLTYETTVVPLILRMLGSRSGVIVDVGCGNGHVMSQLADRSDVRVYGCDINQDLLGQAQAHGPVVRVDLPRMPFGTASADGAIVVLSFEHLDDAIFDELARVVRPGGFLATVANHPFITAAGASSVIDPTDGEIFWRPGSYLEAGETHEEAGDRTVTFKHRPFGEFLTVAAAASWALDELVEIPFQPGGLPDAGLPRLVGARWIRG